jgi:hypothetical protein
MRNVIRLSVLGISVLLISGCQSNPTSSNQTNSDRKDYEIKADNFSHSLSCISVTPTNYPGLIEVARIARIQELVDTGSAKESTFSLKGQSCTILSDAHTICASSSNLEACVAGYVHYSRRDRCAYVGTHPREICPPA